MSSTPPNKEWMTKPRMSTQYFEGVESFIKFAKANSKGVDWFSCPCVKCCNARGQQTLETIVEHLICNGVDQSYKTWYFHGEALPSSSTNNVVSSDTPYTGDQQNAYPRMVNLVEDAFGHGQPDDLDACMDEIVHDDHDDEEQNEATEDIEFQKLKNDATLPLYPSCRPEDTKLSVTVELMSLKARHQWSDTSFTELLETLKKILPSENTLPESVYVAKKMINSLGMSYEMIHACPNDCILYWREHEHLQSCPICSVSRWKSEYLVKETSRRVPVKVLRYFPLTPRLQRLYSVPWIAENMSWHYRSTVQERFMRHPVDSSAWRQVNQKWPDFAVESRNVRLGLATDGFNPFGNKNCSYSCWPVMIVPYNLPPSLCMRKEFIMLSLLIPGKNSPGKNIDVYLQPLIAELNTLWSTGTITYDSHKKTKFNMKAILLWAIHDFPAYGHLAGCKCGGQYACPVCSEGTDSFWLPHGRKTVYMGHRKFLPLNHTFRSQKSQFNGKEEYARAPFRLTRDQVLKKIENIPRSYGKVASRKRGRGTKVVEGSTAWSKRSILFDLPYWKDLPIRHNLDVMHVEKNVAENLIHIIMDTKDKTKDGLQARRDLKYLKIRRNMWPVEQGSKLFLLKAPFALSQSEKELFCKTLSSLKVPIGYSSNWKHRVSLEDLQLKNLISHDYHILLQQLLPVLLSNAYRNHKQLRAAICQVSLLFNVLCSKVICREELMQVKKLTVEALCVFEKYFPPSFFVVMTHLVVHLAEETQVCGPVRYRWMYPFERMMRTYKRYVKNNTRPEGCIAERYIVEESIVYCMEYMPDGREGSHKRGRAAYMDNDDECAGEEPLDDNAKVHFLERVQYEQVRRWVLQSSSDATEWNEKYDIYVQTHSNRGQRRRGNRPLDFGFWLRQQLETKEMSTIKRLADGPNFKAISYKAYRVNGYVFCTAESEASKGTQNSGVSMKAITSFRSSAKDKNPLEEEATYYGVIKSILELNYYEFKQTVFYCDWVQIEDTVNGCVYDPELNLTHVNLGKFKRISKEEDEPFILASQASQVFYCSDPTRNGWHIALEAPKRLTKDVDAYEDPLVFEARMKDKISISALVEDVDYEIEDVAEGSWLDNVTEG